MNIEKLNDKQYSMGINLLPKLKDVAKKINEIIDYIIGTIKPYKSYVAIIREDFGIEVLQDDINENYSLLVISPGLVNLNGPPLNCYVQFTPIGNFEDSKAYPLISRNEESGIVLYNIDSSLIYGCIEIRIYN